jgi:hypothetical protein
MKTQAQRDIEWEKLSRLRWGGANQSPGFVIPQDWRTQVANLPHDDWVKWWNRAGELVQHGPDVEGETEMERRLRWAEDWKAAERDAWQEMVAKTELTT